jgi:nitrite reductase/ring-hydroxylating ferredoxin subunit
VNDTQTTAPSAPFPICRLDELRPDSARTFQLLRRKKSGRAVKWNIFVVRLGEQVAGYYNTCPHSPWNLDYEGTAILRPEGYLQCGKHGARFDAQSGRCFHGPCVGDRLKRVELSLLDGSVCVNNVDVVGMSATTSAAEDGS